MIEINLLPEDLRRTARRRGGGGGNRTWALVGVLLVVVATGVAYFHMMPLGRRMTKNRQLAGQLQKLKKQTDELGGLQADIKHIEKRKRALTNLHEQRVVWAEKLDQFVDIVPENIWLSSMRLTAPRRTRRDSATGGDLILDCYSAGSDEKGITLFRDRLREHQAFWRDVAGMPPIKHVKRPFEEYVEKEALEFTVALSLKAREASKSGAAPSRTQTARSR